MTDAAVDPSIEQQLLKMLNGLREPMLAFCRRLLQTPSVNGVHPEIRIANAIAYEARQLGLDAQIVALQADRPNVVVHTPGKENGGDETGLLLLGHLDTVPPGDEASWTYPPFAATVAKGRLYGRGAIDTKGGMAAALYALAALAQTPGALINGRAQFIGVPDEETGATGTLGLKHLHAQGLLKGLGSIYCYSGRQITLGHRGLVRYRLVCRGQAIHTGAHEWQERTAGASAVTGMARVLLALESLEFPYSTHRHFEKFRTMMTPGTVIHGGVSINIVPDHCEALIDARITPDYGRNTLQAMLDEAIARVAAEQPGVSFEYHLLNDVPAAISDENAVLFQVLAPVIQQVTGGPVEYIVAGPANEGYLLIERGIPCVCGLGPIGANAHAPDEYLEVASLYEAASVYALTASRLDAHLTPASA